MNTYCKIFALSFYLALSFSLAGYSSPSESGNLPPVAQQTADPDREWFYNAETVVFSSADSYDIDGSIVARKWYINGVYQASSTTLTKCFKRNGASGSGCYELAAGVTTVSIKLEVQDNAGDWSTKTTNYTIQDYKQRKYFVTDHIGNVRATVDVDGNVLGYDDYYPFGLSMPGRSSNSANPNDNYKFTGHERDDEAGLTLDYMNARNYDPIIGRFLQIDPLADKFPGWSPYKYVGNNPLKYTDPTGKSCEPWCYEALATREGLLDGSIDPQENAQQSMVEGGALLGVLSAFIPGPEDVVFAAVAVTKAGRIVANWVDETRSAAKGLFKGGDNAKNVSEAPVTNELYSRPTNATTPAQRKSVQGKSCVTCGATGLKNVADHKIPLVKEHYETGGIDKTKMRSLDAVQPQCQTCSAIQGGKMSKYSKDMKKVIKERKLKK